MIVLSSEGADYTPTSEVVSFSAGDAPGAMQSASINILDDELAENLESIDIEASSSEPQATFSTGGDTAVINIMDDNPGEQLSYYIVYSF